MESYEIMEGEDVGMDEKCMVVRGGRGGGGLKKGVEVLGVCVDEEKVDKI